MNIGLYFGTFNPIHIGHLVLANFMLTETPVDEVWLVVTPQNPFKQNQRLLDNHHRYEMVYKATQDLEGIKPCDIEFRLKQPNYTIDTLAQLTQKYPYHQFSLLMGGDNLTSFHKWKNYEAILEDYQIYVYPRIGQESFNKQLGNYQNIHLLKAPIIEISSTYIRKAISERKNVQVMLPKPVWEYIDLMNFYK